MVMLSDAVTQRAAEGAAREDVRVLDVAQILQQSLGGPPAKPTAEPAPDPEPGPTPDHEPAAS
jgi:hypothetical protein